MATAETYPDGMRFVAESILPGYLQALREALDDLLVRLPRSRPRRLLRRLRGRLRNGRGRYAFGALHRLVMVGEGQGWLSPADAIRIRKLAYRCALYLRKATESEGGRPDRRWGGR